MLFGKKAEKKPQKKTSKPTVKKEKISKEVLSESQIREHIGEGWIRAVIIFELVGKPEKHVQETLHSYVENFKRMEEVIPLKEDTEEPMEHEDGMFSAYIEMEALVKNMETLTLIAVNFMPASIEILDPDSPQVQAHHLTTWFNDLLAKLHEVSKVLREERSINAHLTESLNSLIKNTVLVAITGKDRTVPELEKIIGIKAEQLQPFIEHLVKKEQIMKKGEKYTPR